MCYHFYKANHNAIVTYIYNKKVIWLKGKTLIMVEPNNTTILINKGRRIDNHIKNEVICNKKIMFNEGG